MGRYFLTEELRSRWGKKGFKYYHKHDKDIFFVNYDKRATISFTPSPQGVLYDTVNLTVDEELENIIYHTTKELKKLWSSE